jgi:hypothetical protein
MPFPKPPPKPPAPPAPPKPSKPDKSPPPGEPNLPDRPDLPDFTPQPPPPAEPDRPTGPPTTQAPTNTRPPTPRLVAPPQGTTATPGVNPINGGPIRPGPETNSRPPWRPPPPPTTPTAPTRPGAVGFSKLVPEALEASARRFDAAAGGLGAAHRDLAAKATRPGTFGQAPWSKDFNAHLDRLTTGHGKIAESAPTAVNKTSAKLRDSARRTTEADRRAKESFDELGPGEDPTGMGDGGEPPPGRPAPGGGESLPDINGLIPDANGTGLTPEQLRVELQSGVNGTYGNGLRVQVTEVYPSAGNLSWDANILGPDGTPVGRMQRTFLRNADGTISVKHEILKIDDPNLRGGGFGKQFSGDMESWYRSSGVDRITLHAGKENGGYTWAKAGYEWADEKSAKAILARLKAKVRENDPPLTAQEIAETRRIIDQAGRTKFGSPDYPQPQDIARIGQSGGSADFFGKRALTGSSWNGVKPL